MAVSVTHGRVFEDAETSGRHIVYAEMPAEQTAQFLQLLHDGGARDIRMEPGGFHEEDDGVNRVYVGYLPPD